MDVVSSIGAIVGLVFNFSKAIKCCYDIKGRYDEMDETIASVKDELETLQGALKQLMALMMNDLDALSSQWDAEKHLPVIFEGAMKGFDRTILVLMRDLKGVHSQVRDGGDEMGRKGKAKFMWNQSALHGHCVQLRGQAGALQILLAVLQTGSMSDLKKEVKNLMAFIEKLAIVPPPNIPDEPPVYVANIEPTFNLLDFSEDLMDINKNYPAHMDGPLPLNSVHGELLRRELTPNLMGESSRSSSKAVRKGYGSGPGTIQPISPVVGSYYLPSRFDEFGPLPNMPPFLRSTSTQVLNDTPYSSSSVPIPPSREMTTLLTTEDLNAENLKAVHLLQQSNLEELGIIHPSPSSSPTNKSRSSPPEKRLISKRFAKLRLASSSRPQPSSLFLAVLTNDLNTVSYLLKAEDIESRHPITNATPLILAASQGYFSMLELLLSSNANFHAIDTSSRTALHHAASSNSPECTELLLAHGADPNSEDHEKETPLHRAVRYLRSESVEVLLGWTKDPLRARNSRGQTALHLAARNRGLNIISKLCEGAKKTTHVSACSFDEESECKCHVTYEGVNTEDVAGETALQFALRQRSMEAISLLLKYTAGGANAPQGLRQWTSQKLEEGKPLEWERPLHYAMRGSSKTLAKRLLDASADVEMLNSDGKTASEVAVVRENWAGVRSLLSGGGEKAVQWVVTKLTDEEFEQMYGVAGEHEYGSKDELLDIAIKRHQWGKVHLVLRNSSFTTAEKKKIAWTLKYEDSMLSQVIWQYKEGVRLDIVRTMLQHGADANAAGFTGGEEDNIFRHSLLQCAAEKDDLQLAELLVEFGAHSVNDSCMELDDHGNPEGGIERGFALLTAVPRCNIKTITYFYSLLKTHLLSNNPALFSDIVLQASLTAIFRDSIPILQIILPPPPATPSLDLLSKAIWLGRENITRYLLQRGCDPHDFQASHFSFKDPDFVILRGERIPLRRTEVSKWSRNGWKMCMWMVEHLEEKRWEMDLSPEARLAVCYEHDLRTT